MSMDSEVDNIDLSEQLEEVTRLLDELSLTFPVNMSLQDYLQVDGPANAPTCNPDGLLEVDVDVALQEDNVDESETPVVELVPFKDTVAALEVLRTFSKEFQVALR
ncbi:hypothetical protein R1sor_007732 [Riccia sorocarpa]|uniref:Uncharacterized protein n=1 Tax=Riccia sorocarpa TaxID=122646 RepID=A0ABD3HT38_9MARC